MKNETELFHVIVRGCELMKGGRTGGEKTRSKTCVGRGEGGGKRRDGKETIQRKILNMKLKQERQSE